GIYAKVRQKFHLSPLFKFPEPALDDLKKALSERILNAELDDHLDVERLEGGPANRRGTRQSSPRSSSSARSSPTAQP
ncbi:hypothetical protein BMJ31_19835, partial [Sinorhizobium medicae]